MRVLNPDRDNPLPYVAGVLVNFETKEVISKKIFDSAIIAKMCKMGGFATF